jgi:hypothetical protein
MEGESARVPGSAANGCAGNTAAFESPALRSWEMKPPGGWSLSGKRVRVAKP